jgi:hypothetical protein
MKDRPLPPVIYKYFRIDEFFYQHLINSELWFSNPQEFNDPYDCTSALKKTL